MAPAEPNGPTSPTPARTAPPGFKFIKVKKPDGTIVTVKKKLSPEELEKEQEKAKAQPQPQADAPKTGSAPTEAKKDGVQYKIITVRMPDGTLAKVKRPVDKSDAEKATTKPTTGDVAAAATPAKTDTTPPNDKAVSPSAEAGAPEQPLTADEKEALREQALYHKQQRRSRFKTALLFGLVGAADAALPDLLDGDEIMSDTDISDDEDFDEYGHHDDDDGPDLVEGEDTPSSTTNLAPAVAAGAATAVAGVAVAAMAGPPQPPPPARQPPGPANQPNGADAQANGKAENGKGAYKVTVKDLNDLDEKAEKRQESETTLERRWAAFSFYFLASLSVVLPILFLVLACFIVAMNGKSIGGSWGLMIDPIKIAVTVWPIVFAAVTAQAFKTWAAYKVERGVKLMELEQLIGSNSFGAVMKQPFLLRRLDLLTLGIFIIWALSPIGSQALLRTYTLERGYVEDEVAVVYAPVLGNNMLLSPGAAEKIGNPTILSNIWQSVSVYYVGAFMREGVKRVSDSKSFNQDTYNHPLPKKVVDTGYGEYFETLSLYGVPLGLPPLAVNLFEATEKDKDKAKASADAQAPFENITFPITSSYFNFTCLDWKNATRRELNETGTRWSISETLGIDFFSRKNVDDILVDSVRFSSLKNAATMLEAAGLEVGASVDVDDNWAYAVIECGFQQVFYNGTVLCHLDASSGSSFAHDCGLTKVNLYRLDDVPSGWHTPLKDFSAELLYGANPYPVHYPITPIEKYSLQYGSFVDGKPNDTIIIDPANTLPWEFAGYFGMLFNTFIHITHCPECLTDSSLSSIDPVAAGGEPGTGFMSPSASALYLTPKTPSGKAKRVYSPEALVYKLDWRWVAVLLTSVISLLLVGLASVFLESVLVAPDVLGYASTLARNSRYLHLPKTAAKPMSGPERARAIGSVKVMIQDVKPDKNVGKIALGLKHDRAEPLKPGRLYR